MNLLAEIAKFILILFLCASCTQKQSEIQNLTHLLKFSNKNRLDKFLIIDRVVNIYVANKNYEDALEIVNSGIIDDESREYYPLYLYLMGNIYSSMGEDFVAFSIYKRVVNNFDDYVYENCSVKTRAAKKIVNLNIDSIDKINYYKFILNTGIDNLNNEEKGNYFYNLALSLEDAQDYDESYFYYKKFLSIPRSHLKIDSRDYFNVVTKVNYFNNPEFVVYRNLGDLIQDVKNFILSGNTSKLLNIRDKNNFFIQSWDQKGGKSNSINTNSFLTTMIRLGGRRKNGIQFAKHLEADSSDDISYLESSGWDHIREWYFVFKRIVYPKDPEINNGWTWIGVYLGKK
ncbi:hypothetical protein [Borreliella carolinensis]|uniref:Lipoprotein n=1 Tax=Borreliella carolinensis TaxID=478174 RepID=A0ABY9E6F9_9SPIR|nr:hypothetical protein [Borreliella carolinensis]WKC90783.1 hypothetical protein QIA18_02270 [Borreliella carolinensis]WNY67717.1 hypothetical protein QIA42_01955 [Borreliella carolinensis]